jgi:hypothetical protein
VGPCGCWDDHDNLSCDSEEEYDDRVCGLDKPLHSCPHVHYGEQRRIAARAGLGPYSRWCPKARRSYVECHPLVAPVDVLTGRIMSVPIAALPPRFLRTFPLRRTSHYLPLLLSRHLSLICIPFSPQKPLPKKKTTAQADSPIESFDTKNALSELEFDESLGSNRIQITSCGSSRAAVLSSEEERRFFRFMRKLQLEKVEVSQARKGDAAKEKLRKEGNERYRAELMIIHNARFEMW